jgi:hypothetical protein
VELETAHDLLFSGRAASGTVTMQVGHDEEGGEYHEPASQSDDSALGEPGPNAKPHDDERRGGVLASVSPADRSLELFRQPTNLLNGHLNLLARLISPESLNIVVVVIIAHD